MGVIKIYINAFIILLLTIPAVNAQRYINLDEPFPVEKLPTEKYYKTTSSSNPKKQTPEDIIEVYMPIIAETIKLDSNEASLVNTTLVKYLKKSLTLDKAQIHNDSLKLYVKTLEEKQLNELKAILTKSKFEAYVNLRETMYYRKRPSFKLFQIFPY
ncbi:hypothetical protein MWU65_05665 [Cellulophaga sp. F20128]|uniref:hypothetical protein n=1 Tax=Cellulophaga sp. F20128 TaxID=2926413 RepID=UPI001FF225C4|nr:hypothetical protein [Cellulophaga sp. F20128]MCK0156656.1 hypothetical protein [Cellulophaga sp. F20128]